MASVDLSAREYYIPGPSGSYLNYGAAASEVSFVYLLVSDDSRLYKIEICTPSHEDIHIGYLQVEIDLLTGATTILRSDLIYDCGQSLNPAVDLGQVGIIRLTLFYLVCMRSLLKKSKHP